MKIKLDENLPERLVAVLTRLGHDIDTVYAERLKGRVDADVWNGTQAAQRFFITQDLDFSDIRRLRRAPMPAFSWYVWHDPAAMRCSNACLRSLKPRRSTAGLVASWS